MVEGSYTCGTAEFPLLGMTIGEMLKSIVAKYPDTEAVVSVHQNIRWTYRQFLEQAEQGAKAEPKVGMVGPGGLHVEHPAETGDAIMVPVNRIGADEAAVLRDQQEQEPVN